MEYVIKFLLGSLVLAVLGGIVRVYQYCDWWLYKEFGTHRKTGTYSSGDLLRWIVCGGLLVAIAYGIGSYLWQIAAN